VHFFKISDRAESIGRPVGDEAFLLRLEQDSGRSFKPARRGPKIGKGALSP
jgi:putative transposase